MNDETSLCLLHFQMCHAEVTRAIPAEGALSVFMVALEYFHHPFFQPLPWQLACFFDHCCMLNRCFHWAVHSDTKIFFSSDYIWIRAPWYMSSSDYSLKSYYCPFSNVEFHPALCCPLAELCQIPWKALSIFFCLSQPKSLCQLPVSPPDIKE